MPAVVARLERACTRSYFPREVFFFGFGFPGMSLPATAARLFSFLVATDPPRLGSATTPMLLPSRLTARATPPVAAVAQWIEQRFS